MPTVAIDARGGGPGARLLVAELRRFAGLRAPAWRPWSRLVAPHAVHALGGRLPLLPGCPGIATFTSATDEATLRSAALVLCPSQASMRSAAARPGAREATLRVVPLAAAPASAPPRVAPPRGEYALALADDAAPLRDAWRRAAPGVELLVLDDEPGKPLLHGALLLADLRGGVLFGGLALAALERGIPVIAGPGGAVAEAVGDAAIVTDPADATALAAAVDHALADRHALAAVGYARAALFTWSGTAEATVMAYRELW
jgi:glycosyltransferase involved in cell wall biosynthesis